AFFFAAALYMLFGRFVHKAYKKKRTFYAVTDRRVVYLARRRLRDKLYDMPFEDIRKIAGEDTVVDGCGSLTFSRRGVGGFLDPWDWQRDLFCMWGHRGAVLFYDVDGALDLRDWVARLRSVRQEERSGLAAPPLR
ncbi:MAG TPA: hypothetical protein VHJ34_10105, partial [Actinomycetota bacterium]|nr:hypothetical protein [Actinomycetota bacterium]